MSDTLPASAHRVNSSGNCSISGCPCRGWSAQETTMSKNEYQREQFPVGARVEAVIPISRSRLGADIPAGTRGKVTSHCDDGRAWIFFDGYAEGHTFSEIKKYVHIVCTYQNDDERCPANATNEHQPAAQGGGDNGLELPWYWMKETNRILADANKQGQKFIICDMFDKGPKGAARAKYVVEAVNQHQSLVAERERWVTAMRKFVDAYGGGKSLRLGNGQAQRSWNEFRQLLAAYDEQRSTSE